MVGVVQGFKTMNEACKKLESDMAKGLMDHGGNPILRTHAANVKVRRDPADCIKIDKEKTSQKVDGMGALANVYALIVADVEEDRPYESHGIRTLGGDDDDFDSYDY